MRLTRQARRACSRRALAACLTTVAVAASGCSSLARAQPASRAKPSSPAEQASRARASTPDPAGSVARTPAATSCSSRVLEGMTERQRVGQLFLVGLTADALRPTEAAALTSHHFGSVFFVTNTAAGVAGVRSVAAAVQSLATAKATARVRFLVAANQEGGRIQALRGPGFAKIPSALVQGHLRPSALQRRATGWGLQLRAAGVNMDLAPVASVVPRADVSVNQPIGVLHREYGHTPATVASHSAAFIKGMQLAGVATTAKHFPGLGMVRGNTDFTSDVVDTVTTAHSPDLGSFQGAIDAGAPFVMVSLATYERIDRHHLAVFSPAILQGLLRGRMHFRGVILSDDLGAAAAVAHIPAGRRALRFLSAGGDMITSNTVSAAVTMYRAVLRRARTDPAFQREVNSAAAHVLAAKQAAGLLPCAG